MASRVSPNALQVFADLQTAGLPPGAAAGVVGNLIAESDVNPRSVQRRGPGRGIAQWSLGARWSQLTTWAKAKGIDPWTLPAQESYLVSEMKSMGVWQQLQQTTDPNAAAALVMAKYEMPKSKDPTARQSLARQVLTAATGAPAPATTAGAPGGSSSGVGGGASVVPAGLTGTLTGGVKDLVIEGAFVVLAGGLVVLGLSKTFQSQISSALGAVTKVV